MVKLLDRQARLLGLDLKPPDQTVDMTQFNIAIPWGQTPEVVEGEAVEPRRIEVGGRDGGK